MGALPCIAFTFELGVMLQTLSWRKINLVHQTILSRTIGFVLLVDCGWGVILGPTFLWPTKEEPLHFPLYLKSLFSFSGPECND